MTNRASNKLTSTRKMTVRVALASGATIATLFGAQSLSTRDLIALLPTDAATTQNDVDDINFVVTATVPAPSATATVAPTETAVIPTATILKTTMAPAAPNLVIIPNTGSALTTAATNTVTASSTPIPTATAVPATPTRVAPTIAPTTVPTVQPAVVQPRPRSRSSR